MQEAAIIIIFIFIFIFIFRRRRRRRRRRSLQQLIVLHQGKKEEDGASSERDHFSSVFPWPCASERVFILLYEGLEAGKSSA
jgi:cbb3-type cytochrome oxidase subunit 3